MMIEAIKDRRLQMILAKKAEIFSAEPYAVEDCLWITGSGVMTAYRQMFVHITQGLDEVNISVTITNDDRGLTNFLTWGYGDIQDKAAITKMLIFLIEDILNGNGQEVREVIKGASAEND